MFGMYQEYVKIGENAPEVLPPSPPTRDNIELRQPQFIRSFSNKKSWPSDHMPQKAHVAHTYDHGHAALDRPIKESSQEPHPFKHNVADPTVDVLKNNHFHKLNGAGAISTAEGSSTHNDRGPFRWGRHQGGNISDPHVTQHPSGTSAPPSFDPASFLGASPPRLAVIIPYIGPELPTWFPLFAASVGPSAAVADWFLFTAGTRLPSQTTSRSWLPANLKFIDLGLDEMSHLHADALVDDSHMKRRAAELFRSVLGLKPYNLVEFKPAAGHVFEKYLTNYSHWCFSDLDLVMGDLEAWSDELFFPLAAGNAEDPHEPEEAGSGSWDMFAYGFGDQQRMYTRGQWTVHRNTHKVNRVYRGCSFMYGSSLLRRLEGHFRYESAEGCYAQVVSRRPDLRVKYAVKVFTDADSDTQTGREVVLSHGRVLKPSLPHTADIPSWFRRREMLVVKPPSELMTKLLAPSPKIEGRLQQHEGARRTVCLNH